MLQSTPSLVVLFQHTAARRRLGFLSDYPFTPWRFNTQPPEGGWKTIQVTMICNCCFNTQPPEGGWFSPNRL